MLCRKPFMAGIVPFGCGQCLPCRVNRSRQWKWRQFLESLLHEHNCFVTLTYDEDHLPRDSQLEPRALQLFLKSLRKAIAPQRVRFFAVGEYGEQSLRPHYHLSLFGLSEFSVYSGGSLVVRDRAGHIVGGAIYNSWKKGHVHVAEFNAHTASYISGYIIKKLKDRKDGISHRVPEFARQSNRPGIGAGAMAVIAKTLLETAHGWEKGDIPSSLSVAGRSIPLGRYLLRRLRHEVGFTEGYIKDLRDEVTMAKSLEVSAMQAVKPGFTLSQTILEDIEGRLRQVESRSYLFKKRGQI